MAHADFPDFIALPAFRGKFNTHFRADQADGFNAQGQAGLGRGGSGQLNFVGAQVELGFLILTNPRQGYPGIALNQFLTFHQTRQHVDVAQEVEDEPAFWPGIQSSR